MTFRYVTQLFLTIICLYAIVVSAGCAKQKTYGAVKFQTNPPGAEVINLKDDASFGQAPLTVTWEAEEGAPQYVTVEMRKAGYREEITSFWVNTRHETREQAQEGAQPITVDLIKRKAQ